MIQHTLYFGIWLVIIFYELGLGFFILQHTFQVPSVHCLVSSCQQVNLLKFWILTLTCSTVQLEYPDSRLSRQIRASAQCGLPSASELIWKCGADAWNQDWYWTRRHWSYNLYLKGLFKLWFFFLNSSLD